jgi:hypothetical protein
MKLQLLAVIHLISPHGGLDVDKATSHRPASQEDAFHYGVRSRGSVRACFNGARRPARCEHRGEAIVTGVVVAGLRDLPAITTMIWTNPRSKRREEAR